MLRDDAVEQIVLTERLSRNAINCRTISEYDRLGVFYLWQENAGEYLLVCWSCNDDLPLFYREYDYNADHWHNIGGESFRHG
jgi:hypothetical protein